MTGAGTILVEAHQLVVLVKYLNVEDVCDDTHVLNEFPGINFFEVTIAGLLRIFFCHADKMRRFWRVSTEFSRCVSILDLAVSRRARPASAL